LFFKIRYNLCGIWIHRNNICALHACFSKSSLGLFTPKTLLYSCQWTETCKLKFKVGALNFLSVYTFLWCSLFPLIEERLRGKTEKAKVLLYTEKEHEKYTKTEMHESFSTSGSRPSDHCGFKTDAQSLPSLFDSSDLLETVYIFHIKDAPSLCKGIRGRRTWQRSEGWVRCYVKKWFWKISSYLLNN